MINPSRSRFQALSGPMLAVLCLVGSSRGITAADVERYTGVMTLSMNFVTQEGKKIEKGKHKIEVKFDETHWTLSFLRESSDPVVVKGTSVEGDPFILPAVIPVVGTHHLRSSSEPLRTAQERQFSKTGLPQYAEEERNWKSTIRVYRGAGVPGEVFFIFQIRNASGQVTRADFKLRSEAQ